MDRTYIGSPYIAVPLYRVSQIGLAEVQTVSTRLATRAKPVFADPVGVWDSSQVDMQSIVADNRGPFQPVANSEVGVSF